MTFATPLKKTICDSINVSKEIYQRSIWQLSFQLGIWRKKQSDWPFPTSHQTWSRYRPEWLLYLNCWCPDGLCWQHKRGEGPRATSSQDRVRLMFIRGRHDVWHAYYTQRQVISKYVTPKDNLTFLFWMLVVKEKEENKFLWKYNKYI